MSDSQVVVFGEYFEAANKLVQNSGISKTSIAFGIMDLLNDVAQDDQGWFGWGKTGKGEKAHKEATKLYTFLRQAQLFVESLRDLTKVARDIFGVWSQPKPGPTTPTISQETALGMIKDRHAKLEELSEEMGGENLHQDLISLLQEIKSTQAEAYAEKLLEQVNCFNLFLAKMKQVIQRCEDVNREKKHPEQDNLNMMKFLMEVTADVMKNTKL